MSRDLRKRAEEWVQEHILTVEFVRGSPETTTTQEGIDALTILLQAVRNEALEQAAKKLEEDATDVSPWRDAAEEVRALKSGKP